MAEILKDFSKPVVINALEENRYALAPFFYDVPGMEKYSTPEISWCVTDIPFPMCNVAFGANLNAEKTDSTIEAFIARGRAKNVPLEWCTGNNPGPANLGDYLRKHGFIARGNEPGMVIDLLEMKEEIPVQDKLVIEVVRDIQTLKTWVHTTSMGFGITPSTEPALLRWFTICTQLKLPVQLYLGIWKGKPVATSMYLLAAGVAGFHFVATVPEARKHGIGYAITQKALQDARQEGYRIGVLQASKLGYPIYIKLGFKEYSQFGVYTWRQNSLPK